MAAASDFERLTTYYSSLLMLAYYVPATSAVDRDDFAAYVLCLREVMTPEREARHRVVIARGWLDEKQAKESSCISPGPC